MRAGLIPIHLAGGLRTARGAVGARRGWILRLEDGGLIGRGEASPLPAFGGESPQACLQALRRCCALLGKGALSAIEHATRACPVARSAVHGALLELAARRRERPLAAVLRPGASPLVRCNWLGPDPPPGWSCCKLKALRDPQASAARLRRLHAAHPQLRLRLDANGAWSPSGLRAFAAALGQTPLDLLEQPCDPRHDRDMPALQNSLGLPLAFDESLRSPADAERLIRLRPAALVLKPMLLGGGDRCLAIARRARTAGLRVIITDSCCSSVGRRQAAHCAAACDPDGAEHHGLATAWMQGDDDGLRAGLWRLARLGIGP